MKDYNDISNKVQDILNAQGMDIASSKVFLECWLDIIGSKVPVSNVHFGYGFGIFTRCAFRLEETDENEAKQFLKYFNKAGDQSATIVVDSYAFGVPEDDIDPEQTFPIKYIIDLSSAYFYDHFIPVFNLHLQEMITKQDSRVYRYQQESYAALLEKFKDPQKVKELQDSVWKKPLAEMPQSFFATPKIVKEAVEFTYKNDTWIQTV